MEFFLEICLTAILSLTFAFFLSKLLSMVDGDVDDQDSASGLQKNFDVGVVEEERVFEREMKNLRLESQERVEFVGEAVKVDEIQADLVEEKLEKVDEGCEPVEFREGDQIAVHEEGLEGVKASECFEDKFVEERPQKEEVKAGDGDLGEVEKGFTSNKDESTQDNLVQERPETGEVSEINSELAEDEQMPVENEDIGVFGCQSYKENKIEGREKSVLNDEKAGMSSDEDDWEGIERSDLENLFASAAAFAGSSDNTDRFSKVGSDVQMQLYALHKVAMEGPCHEPQPMALKVSARAKWNAWQQLGSMNPDVAMEQYISLLSDRVPGWMGENSGGGRDSVEAGISGTKAPDLSADVLHQHGLETERKAEEHQSSVEGVDAIGDPNLLNMDKL
ncbi:acyl-CoA-binding domain-containing protein 3-like [Macadamia integrifolia]|uniref:acyl-CoA-binding domain-containing protein 3-like n=1 Tax=Macadamia integrifolia TaxID=60698 RepID=UPI001C4E49F9|nr:acyl-CoA-binding domain-containing protein 3-like [Macadamia integrifolia]